MLIGMWISDYFLKKCGTSLVYCAFNRPLSSSTFQCCLETKSHKQESMNDLASHNEAERVCVTLIVGVVRLSWRC